MADGITFVGMDVHKKSISVALLAPGSAEAVQWELTNQAKEVRQLARRLKSCGEVLSVYEAGACGYALQRQLRGAGVACQVVAPSLIPRKAGDRVKTDRRDARKLAELLRAGLLTEVSPPTAAEEALRDLCRCREDARVDLQRARHRLGKMLLRRGLHYPGGRPWTQRHRQWLWSLELEHASEKATLDDYLLAVDQITTRLAALEEKLAELSEQEPYREKVSGLRCFRGIDTLTAMCLLAELHGFERFAGPRKLMAYLGLVPSESSSGASTRRGGITKTGNRHVRRLLIEVAHHYRHRPGIGRALQRRRAGQSAAAIALADRAQHKLHRRYSRMVVGRGMPVQKVVTACARELTGFLWALLYLNPRDTVAGTATAVGSKPQPASRPRAQKPSRAASGLRAGVEDRGGMAPAAAHRRPRGRTACRQRGEG